MDHVDGADRNYPWGPKLMMTPDPGLLVTALIVIVLCFVSSSINFYATRAFFRLLSEADGIERSNLGSNRWMGEQLKYIFNVKKVSEDDVLLRDSLLTMRVTFAISNMIFVLMVFVIY